MDDYDNVPIEQYGLAMLRGMGWKPGTREGGAGWWCGHGAVMVQSSSLMVQSSSLMMQFSQVTVQLSTCMVRFS